VSSPQRSLHVDSQRLSRAKALLERAVDDGAFAGAVALVALGGRVVAHWAIGHAQVEPDPRPMQLDTIFDLASLTKPLAGATAALVLLEDGAWSLDDAVARFIPEFGACGKQDVTVRQLLTHSSGLGAWAATYAHAREPEGALKYICSLPLTYLPGSSVVYSDLGFSMIGHLVRRVTGEGLDALLTSRVWGLLGMTDTGYVPPVALRPRIAATERGNRFEQVMLRVRGESFDGWRDHVLVGEVNDGNTHYALGGISSHAGLFSSAADVLRLATMYLHQGSPILSPATIAAATSDHTPGPATARGLGWELTARKSMPAPRAYGDLLSAGTFGHTGFTGTSLAVDPERQLIIILLTNRTHPDARNDGISAVRPRFHNLVAASLVPAGAPER
jgi:CubicO group peptidase (beta-lactamase class C family)